MLSKLSHVIIMYQLSGYGPHDDYHIVTRIKLNTVIEKHSACHSGYENYYGNFELWQGSLASGTHNIIVEYRNNHATKLEPYYGQTRALTIVQC